MMTEHESRYRTVVTGIGFITPIGNSSAKLQQHITEGKPAPSHPFISPYSPGSVVSVFRAAMDEQLAPPSHRDPVVRFGLAAAEKALQDSGLDPETIQSPATGAVISSSKGGVNSLSRFYTACDRENEARLNAHRLYSNFGPECVSGWVARRYRLAGPVKSFVTACASGTHALIAGARMIEDGSVTCCIAGASDASINPLMLEGYKRMGVYSRDTIRPFDKERDGFIVGEGAGILILEEREHARQRGARIYAEIDSFIDGQETGHALHFDIQKNTLAELLRRLCEKNPRRPVDYINAHATGTQAGDYYETHQIKKAFGRDAVTIPVSSTKSFTGHMLGASGAVEAIICVLAMQHDFVPPTVSYLRPDRKCDLDHVPNKGRKKKLNRILSLSMGFGGHIAIISFSKGMYT